jgi:paraquat-inducible protein B
MSEKTHPLPKAKIRKDVFSWFIWTLPVAAAGLCGWFLLHDFVFAGPTVTIYFQNADGLQEQNSMVKYRGINIGQVTSLKLADKQGRVAVRAKLDYSAGDIARQGAVFWIVQPEVKLGAIQGLQTIVSGNYITVQPGNGERTNTFTGAEEAPVQPAPGIIITLLADDLGALENQSEISYRGIQVGEVIDFHLGDDSRHIVVHARILQNYAPLVRMNSKFWNAGGINAHLGLFSGLNITAESAQTLVSGGIAFATPVDYGSPATNGAVFTLNDKEDTTWQDWNPIIPLQTMPAAAGEKSSLPDIQTH